MKTWVCKTIPQIIAITLKNKEVWHRCRIGLTVNDKKKKEKKRWKKKKLKDNSLRLIRQKSKDRNLGGGRNKIKGIQSKRISEQGEKKSTVFTHTCLYKNKSKHSIIFIKCIINSLLWSTHMLFLNVYFPSPAPLKQGSHFPRGSPTSPLSKILHHLYIRIPFSQTLVVTDPIPTDGDIPFPCSLWLILEQASLQRLIMKVELSWTTEEIKTLKLLGYKSGQCTGVVDC